MRTITSLTTIFALALGLTACGDDKNDATTNDPTTNSTPGTSSATETAGTSTGPGTSEPTTDPATSEPTGGSTDPTATTTTTPETSSSTDPTATTTTEPATSSSTDPGTSTGGAGGEAPYQACMSAAECGEGGLCINAMTTGGQIKGSFCSPPCFGPGKICPVAADGVDASQGAQCIFGPMGMSPTNCALICVVGMDECGPESDCEDIGQPPMMGVTLGVCSVPA